MQADSGGVALLYDIGMAREIQGRSGAANALGVRVCLALVFVPILLFTALDSRAAGASPSEPVAQPVKAQPGTITSSWDRSDLVAARPAQGPAVPDPGFDRALLPDASLSGATGDFLPGNVNAWPQRVHGKIFFLSGEDAFSCSGTLISSRRKNVVFTAGHCVYDRQTGEFVSSLVFIPAYRDGEAPLGIFAATSLLTTAGWINDGSFSYDIGAVALAGEPENELGSRRIAFDLDPAERSWTIYGYPDNPDPPYGGGQLVACDAKTATRDTGVPATIGAKPCLMEQGSSGGGWITDGKYLNSVVSYGYCDTEPELCGLIFGPFFSSAAKALYTDPSIGGSITPGVKFKAKPPKKVRKRKVKFRLAGSGSTPVGFRCRLDQRLFVDCSNKVTISRLSPGRHAFRARSKDQTERQSSRTLTWKFRVKRK